MATITVYVSRGRSVSKGIAGKVDSHGPGTKIELPAAEALRLMGLGFVQHEPPRLAPPSAPNTAAIGMQGQNAQGPTYRR